MENSTLFQVLLFCGVGLVFGSILATLSLVVQKIFRIGSPSKIKTQIYECGVKPLGKTQIQFDVKYYVFALLFIVFDVEFIFLLPWALTMSKVGTGAIILFVQAFIFIAILGVGLYYAWRKKALEWE
jgi:NADH:ubiquinone oxidoreductase subunit 3 (subunit A)